MLQMTESIYQLGAGCTGTAHERTQDERLE